MKGKTLGLLSFCNTPCPMRLGSLFTGDGRVSEPGAEPGGFTAFRIYCRGATKSWKQKSWKQNDAHTYFTDEKTKAEKIIVTYLS